MFMLGKGRAWPEKTDHAYMGLKYDVMGTAI